MISGSRIRVSYLVQSKQIHGWSPEEIYFQHPDISLAQIYSALSYYYTHQQEIEQEITEADREIQHLQAELKTLGAGYEAAEFQAILQAKVKEA